MIYLEFLNQLIILFFPVIIQFLSVFLILAQWQPIMSATAWFY